MLQLEDGVALYDVDRDAALLGVAQGLGLAPVVRPKRDQGVGAVQAIHDLSRETGLADRWLQARGGDAKGEDAALPGCRGRPDRGDGGGGPPPFEGVSPPGRGA